MLDNRTFKTAGPGRDKLLAIRQLKLAFFDDLPGGQPPRVNAAIEALANEGGLEARGAVFTRPEVVDFILDLAGYTEDQPLYEKRLMEPSFGGGDFLLPVVGRLLTAWRSVTRPRSAVDDLGDAIRAVELQRETFHATRAAVIALLEREGLGGQTAETLCGRWLLHGDFLLAPLEGEFDFVVGNPPYVRQELIPAALLAEYRDRYCTIYDRADLYIPFIERSLSLLTEGVCLGFICANRWMKNRYGGPLRRLVAERFHLKIHVDMVDTPAFHSDVIAYPAITIIGREPTGPTRIAHRPAIDRAGLTALAGALRDRHRAEKNPWRQTENDAIDPTSGRSVLSRGQGYFRISRPGPPLDLPGEILVQQARRAPCAYGQHRMLAGHRYRVPVGDCHPDCRRVPSRQATHRAEGVIHALQGLEPPPRQGVDATAASRNFTDNSFKENGL